MTQWLGKMDELDRNLLHALGNDVRITISELARLLGVSRSTAQSRLRRLETNGTIAGYGIRYGEGYEGKQIKAHVQIQVDQKRTGLVLSKIETIREVHALYAVSGDYDLIAEVAADSTARLSAVLDELANLDGVERTNSLVVLETRFTR